MKLFGLNKNKAQTVPAEVQDYYRSERRERAGLAWLLAVGTLIVTLIVAAGLFFGGRWVYRKVAGTGNSKSAVMPQKEQEAKQDTKTSSTSAQSPAGSAPQTSSPSQQAQPPAGGRAPAPGLVNTGPIDE